MPDRALRGVALDARRVSAQLMGQVESEKVGASHITRRTPDGREWIWCGRFWRNLDDFGHEEADWRNQMTRWR